MVYEWMEKCSRIGPRARAGKKLSAPRSQRRPGKLHAEDKSIERHHSKDWAVAATLQQSGQPTTEPALQGRIGPPASQ